MSPDRRTQLSDYMTELHSVQWFFKFYGLASKRRWRHFFGRIRSQMGSHSRAKRVNFSSNREL